MQSEYFEKDEGNADDGTNGDAVFRFEIEEAEDLAARVEVDLDEGVEPVEVDELLEDQGRCDLGFCMKGWVHKVVIGFGCGYFKEG